MGDSETAKKILSEIEMETTIHVDGQSMTLTRKQMFDLQKMLDDFLGKRNGMYDMYLPDGFSIKTTTNDDDLVFRGKIKMDNNSVVDDKINIDGSKIGNSGRFNLDRTPYDM